MWLPFPRGMYLYGLFMQGLIFFQVYRIVISNNMTEFSSAAVYEYSNPPWLNY